MFYLFVFCCFVSYFLCLNILFDVSAPTILQYGLQQLCWIPTCGTYVIHIHYRRRIYTEEKAKVVAAVWRPTLFNFLLFALGWYEENDEFILFFTSSRLKDLKEFCVNPVRIFLRNPDPGDMITFHTYINSSPLLQPIYELFYLFIKGLIQSSLGYNFFFTNTRFIAH